MLPCQSLYSLYSMQYPRPVKFHDLAFFDPVIYESLRQLVVDAEKPGSDNATALQV